MRRAWPATRTPTRCRPTRGTSPTRRSTRSAAGGRIGGITYHAGMLTEVGGVDPDVPLARVIDHVDYVAARIGVDHIGFGSDFDGATVPTELGDASGLQHVAEALRNRGYAEGDVAKLAHGNWLRVLKQTRND